MNIVLDTNILVSAMWSPDGKAAKLIEAILSNRFTLCYDRRIAEEYHKVLRYPKLKFKEDDVAAFLESLLGYGLGIINYPKTDAVFDQDETDRKFYDVGKSCGAKIITGNLKHFPPDPDVMSLADFADQYL